MCDSRGSTPAMLGTVSSSQGVRVVCKGRVGIGFGLPLDLKNEDNDTLDTLEYDSVNIFFGELPICCIFHEKVEAGLHTLHLISAAMRSKLASVLPLSLCLAKSLAFILQCSNPVHSHGVCMAMKGENS